MSDTPNTLDELFARDVERLTVEDAKALVTVIRAKRAEWELAEGKRVSEKGEKRKMPPRTATKEKVSVNFDDLDFGE